jgi:hypothetical protein
MRIKPAAASLGWVLGFAAMGAAPAAAACSDRPGRPDRVSAEVASTTSILFKFRITTRDSEVYVGGTHDRR